MNDKKFCMICPFFKTQSWCFGFCEKKIQYIHTPLKHCSVGFNGEYALTDGGEWILEHWERAIGWAQKRHDALEEFYHSLSEKAKDHE